MEVSRGCYHDDEGVTFSFLFLKANWKGGGGKEEA